MRRALLVIVLGLVTSACGGSAPAPTPTIAVPTLPALPTATLGPSPTLSTSTNVLVPIATAGGPGAPGSGERVVVINTEGDGVNMRIDPSRNAPSVVVVLDGDELEIVGPDRTAEGVTWRNVRDRLGNVGWVSAAFLGPPGSQSTVPTRAATPRATTGPTRPPVTVTVTVPPGTPKPTAPTTPGAEPKPTVAAPSKPQVPAGGLVVQANVSRPVISSGNQGLHVRVTQGGQPIAGARVVAVVQDPKGTKTLDLGSTDSSGVATRSFDVGSPQGTITIAITITTPDGRTANASTSFSSG